MKCYSDQKYVRWQLSEVEEKLNQGYIGGMTEYWTRCREHLLKKLLGLQLLAFDKSTNT